MKNFILLIILLTFNNIIKSQVITTNRIPVGLEHNLLFNAGLGSGSVTASQIQGPAMNLNMMFDGSFLANYSTTAPSLANPVVILIEGLPNAHTQQGGFVGWSTRHWPAKKFKIEGYDVYTANNWVVLANYSTTDYTGNDFYIKVTPGSYTKLKFTFYEGTGTSGNLGLSELFFLHQEATAPYANLIGGGSKWILNGSNISFSTGNVGIGVTSPTAGLHVTSRYNNNGTYISAILGNNYNDWTAFGSINGGKIRGSSEGYLVLESNANGTDKKIYINQNSNGDVSIANGGGKLGIGTTNPSAKLDILTNHTSQTSIRITHNNYNDWVLQKRRSDNTQLFGIKEENSNGSMGLATAGVTRMTILSGGNVGIGCTDPDATLTVNGNIQATRIDITATVPCSDFVFEEDYNLRSLSEVEAFVKENKHLPEVPSAAEFKENGYSVGEMDDILLRKVEELTLYIIEQQKLIEQLQEKVETLEGK